MSKASNFVDDYTAAITQMLSAMATLGALDTHYVAVAMGDLIVDADCAQQGITRAQFIDGISAARTVAAVVDVNKTPLYRLKQR